MNIALEGTREMVRGAVKNEIGGSYPAAVYPGLQLMISDSDAFIRGNNGQSCIGTVLSRLSSALLQCCTSQGYHECEGEILLQTTRCCSCLSKYSSV